MPRIQWLSRGTGIPNIHWVSRGTGIPKDRDKVNRREVSECDKDLLFIINR